MPQEEALFQCNQISLSKDMSNNYCRICLRVELIKWPYPSLKYYFKSTEGITQSPAVDFTSYVLSGSSLREFSWVHVEVHPPSPAGAQRYSDSAWDYAKMLLKEAMQNGGNPRHIHLNSKFLISKPKENEKGNRNVKIEGVNVRIPQTGSG